MTLIQEMPTSKVSEIIKAVTVPEYWANLNPELSITVDSQTDLISVADDEVDEVRQRVAHEGYFQLDDLLSLRQVQQLATAVRRLHERRCPIVFAFVYDEFWNVCRKLSPLISHVLTRPYWQLPDFWVWYLDPSVEGAGWRPHRDKGFGSLLPDGMPKSLTVWVPLTDATPLNGCMYVVPTHLDPPSYYAEHEDKRMPRNLQDVRALPVKAGSVLGWNQAILHWGGRASPRAKQPRISFACEFQRADVEPCNRPLLDPLVPPPFRQRLQLIGKQILQYRHMYSFSDALSEMGEHLAKMPDD